MPLALVLLFCGTGCQESRKAPEQGAHFLYYPLRNVYYDQDHKRFYVYDSTKQHWKVTGRLTTEEETTLGKSVVLDTVDVPVYLRNEQHRFVYGAAVYADTISIEEKYRSDSIASQPKPVVVNEEEKKADTTGAATAQKKKKRSKLRSWLDKVFSKKKKEG